MQTTNIGILLGIVSGILLGSFALPMKKVKTWQWEHTWVLFSFWGTIVFPLTIPNLLSVYTQTPLKVILVVFLFGAGWGVSNVGYGIGLKMVGLAMGTAIVLGLNNAIGAILPIFLYTPDKLFQPVGLTLSAGVLVMIAGIIFCAISGMKREKALKIKTDVNGQKNDKSLFWSHV
jgi:L-rhamnose-H+ transport protein